MQKTLNIANKDQNMTLKAIGKHLSEESNWIGTIDKRPVLLAYEWQGKRHWNFLDVFWFARLERSGTISFTKDEEIKTQEVVFIKTEK